MAGSYKQTGRYNRSPKTVERFKRVNRIKVMGSREDDDYWNDKYDWDSVPECEIHGDTQYCNAESGEYECYDCIDEEDMVNG